MVINCSAALFIQQEKWQEIVLILLFLTACINEFVTVVCHMRSDSLIEGVGQRLCGVDWHLAMLSCGKHGALPHVLSRVLHHKQVILFE